MYHIFMALALMASQNQINQMQKVFDQQEKAYYRAQNQNHPTSSASGDANKVLEQLKQEVASQEEAERKSIKPEDLESLGLDPVNDVDNSASSADKALKAKVPTKSATSQQFAMAEDDGDDKNSPPDTVSDTPPTASKTALVAPDVPTSAPVDKKSSTTNSAPDGKDQIKATPSKSTPITTKIAELVPAKKNAEVLNKIEDKKTDQPTATNVTAKVADTGKDTKSEDIKKAKEAKENAIKNKKNNQKIIRKIFKHKNKKRISSPRDRRDEKEKLAELEELRKKYLEDSEEDYQNINRYQQMSKIVTQKKVISKFVTDDIPPPLLMRVHSADNIHHPIIMTIPERIDLMFKAISENRTDDFNALFNLVNDPNIRNSYGDTLLTFAILMRRYDAVSSLLAKGANPELVNGLGYTPLNIAIELSDYKSASLLIDMGAKVNFVDSLGRTYLMEAVRVGSLQLTDLLVTNGAEVNIVDNHGTSALAIAYNYKQDIIVKYLLKHGAINLIKKDYINGDDSMVDELFNKWQ